MSEKHTNSVGHLGMRCAHEMKHKYREYIGKWRYENQWGGDHHDPVTGPQKSERDTKRWAYTLSSYTIGLFEYPPSHHVVTANNSVTAMPSRWSTT